jgi:hypothetical protein
MSATEGHNGGPLERMVRLWADFQYVRLNARQPLDGVTRHGNGGASFRMKPSTLRFGECYDRLPKWMRKLATMTAKKPNDPSSPTASAPAASSTPQTADAKAVRCSRMVRPRLALDW